MILDDANVFIHGYELQSEMNAVSIDPSAETKDDTVFGQQTRSHELGLKTVAFSMSGLVKQINEKNLANIDLENVVLTTAEQNIEGAIAYSFKAGQSAYNKTLKAGEQVEFSLDAFAKSDMLRGYISNIEKGVSADGAGNAINLGAVSAGQKLYACLHVLKVSGNDTLDVSIEMDASGTFNGSETTVATFNSATNPTSEWVEVDSALAGDFYRAVHDVTGTAVDVDYIIFLAVK